MAAVRSKPQASDVDAQANSGDTAVQALVDDILHRAVAEVEEACASMAELIDRRLTQTLETSQQAYRQAMTQAHRTNQRQAEQLRSEFRRDWKQHLMGQRQLMLDSVLAQARSRLGEISLSPEYPQVLSDLAVQGICLLGSSRALIQLNGKDQAIVDQQWMSQLVEKAVEAQPKLNGLQVVLKQEPAPIVGGVIVSDEAGINKVDNSFDQRLDRMWPSLQEFLVARFLA